MAQVVGVPTAWDVDWDVDWDVGFMGSLPTPIRKEPSPNLFHAL